MRSAKVGRPIPRTKARRKREGGLETVHRTSSRTVIRPRRRTSARLPERARILRMRQARRMVGIGPPSLQHSRADDTLGSRQMEGRMMVCAIGRLGGVVCMVSLESGVNLRSCRCARSSAIPGSVYMLPDTLRTAVAWPGPRKWRGWVVLVNDARRVPSGVQEVATGGETLTPTPNSSSQSIIAGTLSSELKYFMPGRDNRDSSMNALD